jgi:hypothetical protein
MSTQEVVINRMADRVNFLAVKKDWGKSNGVAIGDNEVSVICWLGDMATESPVTLHVRSNGFDLGLYMTPAQARMVAKALLAAADEADAPGSSA